MLDSLNQECQEWTQVNTQWEQTQEEDSTKIEVAEAEEVREVAEVVTIKCNKDPTMEWVNQACHFNKTWDPKCKHHLEDSLNREEDPQSNYLYLNLMLPNSTLFKMIETRRETL